MDDASEVERLRARVAELESQTSTGDARNTGASRDRRSPWWAAGSAILITLACVLAPLSVAAVWASTVLSDTERYVETVAPIADDPGVQDALADEVTTVIFENLAVEEITTQALETLAAQENLPPRVAAALPGLAVPITNGVEGFTRDQVDAFLASEAFATIWDQVNRVAHEQVVTLLEGNEGGAVSAQGDTITLNLGPIVAEVKARLVDRGFGLANNIPEIDRSFVLAQSDAITQAQSLYRLLNTLGVWLPIIALALFVIGVVLARDRRRALIKGALGIAGAMIVLGAGLALARSWYVGTTPADVLTGEAAGNVFDTLVRFLRTGVRAVGVLALVVALAAFLAGPSNAAVKTRVAFGGGIGSLREGAASAGWNTGGFGTWIYVHKRALQIGALIAGGVVLMFWTRPTGWVVVWIAVLVVLLLALIEFLGQPAAGADAGPVAGEALPVVAEESSTDPRQAPRPPTQAPSAPPAAQKGFQPSEKGTDRV